MSRKNPSIPKGAAMFVHDDPRIERGRQDFRDGKPYHNPFDFFDSYQEHYAWDIGYQMEKRCSTELFDD